jgi:transcriptional regulator with XRE-family HTH domain
VLQVRVGCCMVALVTADPVAFGRRLAELRKAAGLIPAQAARRAGVNAAYWSVVEGAVPQGRNRRASLPRVPVVRALADAVDADKAELLELAGYPDDAELERDRVARLGEVQLSASGIDLEELRLADPEAYANLEAQARFFLDRARRNARHRGSAG